MSSTLTRPPADEAELGEMLPPPVEPFLSAEGPWRRRDGVVAGVVAAIGLAGLVGCFLGAADERYWREQLDWVTAAGLCTALFVLAVAGWILVGMRRLRRGFRLLADRKNTVLGLDLSGEGTAPGPDEGSELVRVVPQNRVHRPSCLLLRGKSATVVPAEQLDSYDRCGVCRS
jgi:hypothetical protein